MPRLKIDLQEVFSGERVVLSLDGREIYRGMPRTRMQIGLAESRSFDLPRGRAVLKAELPEAGATAMMDLDLTHDLYVGLTLIAGKLSLRASGEDFKYA